MTSQKADIEEPEFVNRNQSLQEVHGSSGTTYCILEAVGDSDSIDEAASADVQFEIFCEYCGISCHTVDDHKAHLEDEHDINENKESPVDLAENSDSHVLSVFPTCSLCKETFEDDDVLAQHSRDCRNKQAINNVIGHSNLILTPSLTKSSTSSCLPKFSTGNKAAVTFKCQFCECSFTNRDSLEHHVDQGHDLVNRFVCDICKKTFEWEKSLLRHMRTVHPIFEFEEQGLISKPAKPPKTDPDVLYQCAFCDKRNTFTWFKSLKVHIRNFHDDYSEEIKKEMFEIKATDFESQGNVNTAIGKINTKVTNESNKDQAATLTGEKNRNYYKCPKCDLVSLYRFAVSKHLIRKHEVEAVEANNMVEQVDRSAVDISSIKSLNRNASKQHLKQFHYNYVCPICSFATYQLSNFKTHMYSQKHQMDFSRKELDEMNFHFLRVKVKESTSIPLSKLNVYYKCPHCWFISRNRKYTDHHNSIEHDMEDNITDKCQVVELVEVGTVSETEDHCVNHSFYKCPYCELYLNTGIELHVANKHSTEAQQDSSAFEPVEITVKFLPDINIIQVETDARTVEIKTNADEDTENGECMTGNVSTGFSDAEMTDYQNEPLNDGIARTNEPEVGSKRQLICPLCETEFYSCYEMMTHCRTHKTVRIYFQCPHCPTRLVRFSSVKRHYENCHTDIPFTAQKSDLIETTVVPENDESGIFSSGFVSCPYCFMSIATVASLMRHVVRQHIEQIGTTPLWQGKTESMGGKTVTPAQGSSESNSPVIEHETMKCGNHSAESRMNTSKRVKSCIVCPETFQSIENLITHLLLHKDVIFFECNFCDLSFNVLLDLVKHMLKHPESDITENLEEYVTDKTSKAFKKQHGNNVDTETVPVNFRNKVDGSKLAIDKVKTRNASESEIADKNMTSGAAPLDTDKHSASEKIQMKSKGKTQPIILLKVTTSEKSSKTRKGMKRTIFVMPNSETRTNKTPTKNKNMYKLPVSTNEKAKSKQAIKDTLLTPDTNNIGNYTAKSPVPSNQRKNVNSSKDMAKVSNVKLKNLTVKLDKIDNYSQYKTPSKSKNTSIKPTLTNDSSATNDSTDKTCHKDKQPSGLDNEVTDVKSNYCPHCHLSFKRASALVSHINFSHPNGKHSKNSATKAVKLSDKSTHKVKDQAKPVTMKDIDKANDKKKGEKTNTDLKANTKDKILTPVGRKRKKSPSSGGSSAKKKRIIDEIEKDHKPKNEIFSHGNESTKLSSDGNRCPHCEFSCRRSSALVFHINFNHAKLMNDVKVKPGHDRSQRAKNSDSDYLPEEEEVSHSKKKQNSHNISNNRQHRKRVPDKDRIPVKAIADIQTGKKSIKTTKNASDADLDMEVVEVDCTDLSQSIEKVTVLNDSGNHVPQDTDNIETESQFKPDTDEGDDFVMNVPVGMDVTGSEPHPTLDLVDFVMSDTEGSQQAESGKHGSSTKTYTCSLCNVRYSSHSALWRHNRIKHNHARNYTCLHCDSVFTFQNQLSDHMRVHMEKSVLCMYDNCSGRFSCDKYRLKHMRKVHGHVPPLKDKSRGPKVYRCDPCDLDYSSHSALWRHNIKRHSQRTRSHACPHCGRAFMWAKELQDHILIHTDDKKFDCKKSFCDRSFKTHKDLTNHDRRMHPQTDCAVKSYKCALCKKVFRLYSSIQSHLLLHNTEGGQSRCDTCDETFENSAELQIHRKTHSDTFSGGTKNSDSKKQPEVKVNIPAIKFGVDDNTAVVSSSDRAETAVEQDDETAVEQDDSHILPDSHLEDDGLVPSSVSSTQQSGKGSAMVKIKRVRRTGPKPFSYHCDQCGKIYGSSTALKSHHIKHHGDGDRPHKCDECSKSYWHPYELKDHKMSVHTTETPFICEECGKGFPTLKGFQSHVKRHRAREEDEAGIVRPPMTCDICGLTISSRAGRQSLYKHIQRSHPETVYCTCEICSAFYDENNAELLEKIRAVCHVCRQCFCQKRYLESHLNTVHSQFGTHECKFCTARFATPKMLSNHVHKDHKIDQQTFQRTLPLAALTNKGVTSVNNTLKVNQMDAETSMHIIQIGQDGIPQYLPKLSEGSLSAVIKELRVQNDDADTSETLPFKCLLCGRCFAKVKYVNLHIRRTHIKNEDQPYRCKVCGSGFVRLAEFRKHSRAHSNFRPYKCRHCKKAFKQQANLKEHEIVHSYVRSEKCLFCKKTFKQRGTLTSHLLSHSKLHPFKCPFCDKAYPDRGQLSRHMKQYLSIKEKGTHMCHICSETFTHYPLLMTHLTTHNPAKPFKCEVCQEHFRSFVQIYFHKAQKDHFTVDDFEGIQQVEDENSEVIITSGELQNLEYIPEGSNEYQSINTPELPTSKSSMTDQSKATSFPLDQSELSILNSNSEVVIETVGYEPEGTVYSVPDGHTSDEILSIAKQLTELSGYTKSPGKHITQPHKKDKEQIKIEDEEQEILLQMLDVDEDKINSLEKLTHRKWDQLEIVKKANTSKLDYPTSVVLTRSEDYDEHPGVDARTGDYGDVLEKRNNELVTDAKNAGIETTQGDIASTASHNTAVQSDRIQINISDGEGNITVIEPKEIQVDSQGNITYVHPEQIQTDIVDTPGDIGYEQMEGIQASISNSNFTYIQHEEIQIDAEGNIIYVQPESSKTDIEDMPKDIIPGQMGEISANVADAPVNIDAGLAEDIPDEVADTGENICHEQTGKIQAGMADTQENNTYNHLENIQINVDNAANTTGPIKEIDASASGSEGNITYVQPDNTEATQDNVPANNEEVDVGIGASTQDVVMEVASNAATSEHDYWGHVSAYKNSITSTEEGTSVVYVYVDSTVSGNPQQGNVVQVIDGLEYMEMATMDEDLAEAVSQLNSDSNSTKFSQINFGEPSVKIENAMNEGDESIKCETENQDTAVIDSEIGTYETGIQMLQTEEGAKQVHAVISGPSVDGEAVNADRHISPELETSGMDQNSALLPQMLMKKMSLPETLTLRQMSSLPEEIVVSGSGTGLTLVDTTSELAKTLIGTDVGNQSFYISEITPKNEQILEDFEATSVMINVKETQPVGGRFQCPICEVQIKSRKNLRKHLQRHQGHKLFACDHPGCEKSFFQMTELRRHFLTHNNMRPHKCDMCGKAFRQAGHLQTHKRLHTGERPFSCPYPECGLGFVTGTQLKIHYMRAHVDESHFNCSLCPRRFKDRHSFALHIGHQHSGVFGTAKKKSSQQSATKKGKITGRMYMCDQCGIEMSSRTNLEDHMNIHSDNKPFICHACGAAFRTMRVLNQHMGTRHGSKDQPKPKKRVWKKPDVTYQCPSCKKIFRGRVGYSYHIGSNEKCRSELVLPSVQVPDVRVEI